MQHPLSSASLGRHRKPPLKRDGRRPLACRPPAYDMAVKCLQIVEILQTSLDLAPMLHGFVDTVRDMIAIDGISYELSELDDTTLHYGSKSRHSCSYRLSIEGQELGQLVFSRAKRFSAVEMALLEEFLELLLHPLRNAILYQRALMAAYRDPLTGLHNRASLDRNLSREIGLARRYDHPLTMLVIDIDKFKVVNDKFGHVAGDRVIACIGTRILDSVREIDMAARYGGEEFVVLLSNTPKAGGMLVAERIRRSVASSICPLGDGDVQRLTISIGVEEMQMTDSANSLFERADQALYAAKNSGRNCVCSA